MSTTNQVQASSLMMPGKLYNHIKEILEHSLSSDLSEELRLCKDVAVQADKPTDTDSSGDYRLMCLLIKNFRRYNQVTLSPEAYFGLKFTDDKDQIFSKTFILGRNGSGKSTAFNAAEFLFTKNISEASYRSIGNIEGFIAGSQRTAGDITVLTKGKGAISDMIDIPLPITRFFISENSILEATRSLKDQDNWFPFFCELLGVGDIYHLVNNLLPKISDDIRSIRNRVNLHNRKYQRLRVIEDLTIDSNDGYLEKFGHLSKMISEYKESKNIDTLYSIEKLLKELSLSSLNEIRKRLRTAVEQLEILLNKSAKQSEDGKSRFNVDVSTEEKQQEMLDNVNGEISNLEDIATYILTNAQTQKKLKDCEESLMSEYVTNGGSKLLSIEIDEDNNNETLKQIEQYSEATKKGLTDFVSAHIDQDFKLAIERMLKEKFLDSRETIHLDISDISSNSITFYVEYSGNQKQTIPVNRYFNTFRFRLIFLSLQSLLCIKMMQQTCIFFPLLFDDVFYANDYINKNQLVHFFEILDSYAQQNDNVRDKLQLIFFSHDEQLINVVHKNYRCDKSVQFARMVDTSLILSTTKSIISLEHEGVQYSCCQSMLPIYKSENKSKS